ncbi:MAG: hypothetical protein LBW85_09695 [Deltaproteobacteria bacterium]|nr:hypothetical protein [Deltaproteobacteria bacterium]
MVFEKGKLENREFVYEDRIYSVFYINFAYGGEPMISGPDFRRFGIDMDRVLKDKNWNSVTAKSRKAFLAFHKRMRFALAAEKFRRPD